MSDILRASGLHKVFQDGKREVSVLAGVDLSVGAGESIAIIGQSGSGKSTLLHLLGTLDPASEGEVYLHGQATSHLPVSDLSELRNRHLGFIYQFHHLLPEFSALENVAMPLLVRNDSTAQAAEKSMRLLRDVGLSERMSHRPQALSGGERQRVAIARAMVGEPSCILADEPTGNLDKKTATHVYELLMQLNQARKTSLIVVTHDTELAKRLDRQYILEEGQLTPL